MSSTGDSDNQADIRSVKKVKMDPATQETDSKLGKRARASPEEQGTTDGAAAKEVSARAEVLTSPEGNSYIELGKQKRITVRKFKGMVLIDIREYYGKAGEEKPGKKGISLTLEQWRALQSVSNDVNHLIDQLS